MKPARFPTWNTRRHSGDSDQGALQFHCALLAIFRLFYSPTRDRCCSRRPVIFTRHERVSAPSGTAPVFR